MALLGSLLRGTDWSQVTEYLSPVFFQVVPPLAMAGQVSTLASDYVNKSKFAKICAELSPHLERSQLPKAVPASGLGLTSAPQELTKQAEQDRGDMLLKLYFWQILNASTVLLDLRYAAFASEPGGASAQWRPQPLYITYQEPFARAVRDLYIGFYTGDDQRLEAALAGLELGHAKDLFLQHFSANQQHLRFELVTFRNSFHQIFLSCKTHKSRLHPNFLGFGAGLFCLYEHLEKLGGAYDVRAAFMAASGDAA